MKFTSFEKDLARGKKVVFFHIPLFLYSVSKLRALTVIKKSFSSL